MAYHDDLLQQARALFDSEQGPGRPKQATLRRAVSTAYYALFHLLVNEATGRMPLRGNLRYRRAVGRAFNHGEMKKTSEGFAGGRPSPALGPVVIPQELVNVAQAFVDLQEERHRADYDLNHRFTKTSTQVRLQQAEAAFVDWESVSDQDSAVLFLTLLPLSKLRA
jgi:hypothetical protein